MYLSIVIFVGVQSLPVPLPVGARHVQVLPREQVGGTEEGGAGAGQGRAGGDGASAAGRAGQDAAPHRWAGPPQPLPQAEGGREGQDGGRD